MYTKDKAIRITLRLNDNQFAFVKTSADVLGVSPSEFLRMVINASMSACKGGEKLKEEKEDLRRENEQACVHNLV